MASADWGQVRPSHLGEALVLNWSLHPGRGLPQNDEWITCLAVIAPMCSAAFLAAAAGDSCAVMTCSDADEACPIVQGADARFAIPYEDPKAFDGTREEAWAYDERCRQIAREMLYVFSKV